ncbi:MAG TPA: methyltransferase [Chryseolinea sp.]
MRNKSHFHFKKFTVSHARSTMKVGTDAVLLGAWANIAQAETLLDIGTGNGTIALMLAQRSSEFATIDAVEIEESDAAQAEENFKSSPWDSKIFLHHTSIQNFISDKQYDCIVSNPPYFNNSQRPPGEKRHQARHTITLSYQELIDATVRLLKHNGKFNVVLPFTEGLQFIDLCRQNELFCARQYSFRTRPEKAIERWLLEFGKYQVPTEAGEIVLYDEAERWSDGYKKLTVDFYLKA